MPMPSPHFKFPPYRGPNYKDPNPCSLIPPYICKCPHHVALPLKHCTPNSLRGPPLDNTQFTILPITMYQKTVSNSSGHNKPQWLAFRCNNTLTTMLGCYKGRNNNCAMLCNNFNPLYYTGWKNLKIHILKDRD